MDYRREFDDNRRVAIPPAASRSLIPPLIPPRATSHVYILPVCFGAATSSCHVLVASRPALAYPHPKPSATARPNASVVAVASASASSPAPTLGTLYPRTNAHVVGCPPARAAWTSAAMTPSLTATFSRASRLARNRARAGRAGRRRAPRRRGGTVDRLRGRSVEARRR